MKYSFYIILFVLLSVCVNAQEKNLPAGRHGFVLVIHGGAGTIVKSQMIPEKEKAYRQGLQDALDTGYNILKKGGTSLDAVEATVKVMEDNPLFNAGKGAVFTSEGRNELDASIMDGKTLKAGAVAGVTIIKNPVAAARAVMDKSEHVMLAGNGAEKFAAENGCDTVDPSYFFTEDRWKALQKAKMLESENLKPGRDSVKQHSFNEHAYRDNKYGTVGAVAVDMQGNLAAATSTGGLTNKRFGRIGDSPIIGAGTYADNATCAVSCTGHGEYFIRLVMAKSVSDRMELAHMNLKDAANEMIMKKLNELGGDGGLIAVDKDGNIAMPFNTEGMYRGYIKSSGEKEIMMYR